MLLGCIGIFIAMIGFGITLEIPKKYIVITALVGIVSGFVYLLGVKSGCSTVFASFLSALTAALISHIFARVFKAPVILFLITGILPTVPGGSMYRIAAGVLDNNSTMVFNSFIEVLEIAGAIALAIFIVDAAFRVKGINRKN